MNNINKLIEDNPTFKFESEGEVGLGRSCVGIIDGNNYVNYCVYNEETLETISESTAEIAPNAYHKHPCLAILVGNITKEEAIKELDEWIGRIFKKGYRIQEYLESKNSIASVLSGRRLKLKAIVDKEVSKPTSA